MRAYPSSATAGALRPAISKYINADRFPTRLSVFDGDTTSNRSFDKVTNRGETTAGGTSTPGNDNPGGSGTGGGPPGPGTRGGEEHPGDFVVTLPNGYKLQCRVEGPEGGTPIFQLHGTPGSRVDTAPPELLDRLGVRLTTYDRPGYGGSDPQEGLKIADGAMHVEAIADHLGIEKFAVVGRSGGAAYAAAVAAGLPDRVTRVALLVPNAPPALMKEQFLANLNPNQQAALGAIEEYSAEREASFRENPTDPMTIIGIPWDELGSNDREVAEKYREHLCNNFAEALRQGTAGWNGDINKVNGFDTWGFEYRDIKCPAIVWTASGDKFTAPAYAERIAAQLSPEQGRLYMVLGGDVGHLGAMEIKPGAFAWLAGKEDLARFPTDPPPGHTPGEPVPTTLEQWTSLAEPNTG
ncbi:alpha/beta hydrolase [Nocardia vinacea]|uniref:alpha/beta fold hydrolase n=1 Tax=Nocardia vinacea TaxID=96468 RepID=UPI0033C3ADF2